MATQTANVIRSKIDTQAGDVPFVDAFTGKEPVIWRGQDYLFQFGLFRKGTLDGTEPDVLAVNNLSSATLDILAGPTGLILQTQTILAFDNTLDATTWNNLTKQHLLFTFADEEMLLAMGGAQERSVWILLRGLTTAGNKVVFGFTHALLKEASAHLDGPAPTDAESYYTEEEADARFLRGAKGSGSIGLGVETVAVTFPAVLDAVPEVVPTLYIPSGDSYIACWVQKASITTSGFTLNLGAPTPNANYQYAYHALL